MIRNEIVEAFKDKDLKDIKDRVSQIMLDNVYSTTSFTTYTFEGIIVQG